MSHRHVLLTASLVGSLGLATAMGACARESSEKESPKSASTTTSGAPSDSAAKPDEGAVKHAGAVKHEGRELMDDLPSATKPAGEKLALDGTTFGNGITQKEPVSIAEIMANPEAYAGKNVRVEGTVSDVCPKRGCWFEMAGEKPGDKMRFKVRDGDMVFPMDAKGKYAVAEGVVYTRELTMEQTREYLQYQASEYGKEFDPAAVTEPVTIVQLNGSGAVIRDGK